MQNTEHTPTIYCFGDSWAAGAELAEGQHPFLHWVAQRLCMPYQNFGQIGSSLGIILHSIIIHLEKIKSTDVVIVIVPPDTRWYDQSQALGFYTLMSWQRDEYFDKFLNKKTLEWFIYHHSLFIYTIQKLLNDAGCRYIMAHNYGQIGDYKKYSLPIDYSKFLNEQSLTELLSGHQMEWQSYPGQTALKHTQDGPPPEMFSGVYFAGCETHPNELGHKKIAELMLEMKELKRND